MKKFFLSFFVVLTFIAYAIHQRKETIENPVIPPKIIPTGQQSAVISQPPSVSTPVSSGPVPSSVPPTIIQTAGSLYRDGSYTGNVADAFYGNIQVKAIIQNGKITDVQFLQYPNDRVQSIAINTQAMPYLKQEAIQAQNSQVDIISGATDTSSAFIESMQSALSQAKSN